jgi:DNA-binding PadR family transcriptional regulator
VLRERGKHHSIKIKWGSLYTVVRSLERHGFIEATGTFRQGRRPERTVYALTDAGREEMRDWLRELLAVPEKEFPSFEGALSLAGALPPEEVEQLLTERLRRLETELAEVRSELAALTPELPRVFLLEAEYAAAMRQAEAEWIRSLLSELADGSLDGLDVWRRFHRQPPSPWEGGGPATP